ncbi:efflux RND transporter periplasmic adaptor subunit [Aquibacillus halophilus]|nr:HlyD family efflux transporter periplasmic adaptor subunit [Aquibacillus halophilus]
MKHKKYSNRLVLITILPFLISISACSLLAEEEKVLAPPLVEPAKVEYDVAEVQSGEVLQRITGNASFIPASSETLSYEQSGGRLQEIHVSEGDVVEKGQLLAEIDSGDLAYEINQLEIEHQIADLRLQQIREQATDTFSIKIAELQKKGLELRLTQLRNQLSSSRITSPISGIITFVTDQNLGENVEAFQSIVQVADSSNLQLIYSTMTASDLSDTKVGMNVNISINGESVQGEIVQTPETVPEDIVNKDPDLYKRSLLIDLKNPEEIEVEIGGSVNIEIITANSEDTLIIPKNGLRTSFGRTFVQVLVDNTKREIDIEPGIVSDTEVEVLKGLKEGDKVILK